MVAISFLFLICLYLYISITQRCLTSNDFSPFGSWENSGATNNKKKENSRIYDRIILFSITFRTRCNHTTGCLKWATLICFCFPIYINKYIYIFFFEKTFPICCDIFEVTGCLKYDFSFFYFILFFFKLFAL